MVTRLMVITLKCIEISFHYVVYHKLTSIGQLNVTNKLTEKQIRSVITRSGGTREKDWRRAAKRYKLLDL